MQNYWKIIKIKIYSKTIKTKIIYSPIYVHNTLRLSLDASVPLAAQASKPLLIIRGHFPQKKTNFAQFSVDLPVFFLALAMTHPKNLQILKKTDPFLMVFLLKVGPMFRDFL